MQHPVQTLLIATFSTDLGRLIFAYFRPRDTTAYAVGRAGDWHGCITSDSDRTAYVREGACRGGYYALVNHIGLSEPIPYDLIKHSARGGHINLTLELLDHLDPPDRRAAATFALPGACAGGHLALSMILIIRGAVSLDIAMMVASKHGHLQPAALMLAYGAIETNWSLSIACPIHPFIVELMLTNGATYCGSCRMSATKHRRFPSAGAGRLIRRIYAFSPTVTALIAHPATSMCTPTNEADLEALALAAALETINKP